VHVLALVDLAIKWCIFKVSNLNFKWILKPENVRGIAG